MGSYDIGVERAHSGRWEWSLWDEAGFAFVTGAARSEARAWRAARSAMRRVHVEKEGGAVPRDRWRSVGIVAGGMAAGMAAIVAGILAIRLIGFWFGI